MSIKDNCLTIVLEIVTRDAGCYMYAASQDPMQTKVCQYYFYFLPNQIQTYLDHFNALDELCGEISIGFDNR